MTRRRLAAAALLAAAVALPAGAGTSTVIRSDVQIGPLHTRGALLKDAVAAFGKPVRQRTVGSMECRVQWSNGLAARFLDLGQKDPCGQGGFVTGSVIGKAWRTSVGLRVGDPISKVRTLYRRASYHRNAGPQTGWWLVTRKSCETGGFQPYPGLLARAYHGRVGAFVVQMGVCE